MNKVKGSKSVFQVKDTNYFAMECSSPSDFDPIVININGHVTAISPYDYLINIDSLCIIGFIDLGT